MKPLLAVLALVIASSGCIVRTHNSGRCAPNHHWERGVCVRDGSGPVIHDHR